MSKHWYVVQVYRGQEDNFIQRLNNEDYEVFTPKQTQLFKRRDRVIKTMIPLFPGYIFIATDKDYVSFRKYYQQSIYILDGCVKIL